MPRISSARAAWLNFRRIKCERWSERQCHPARRRRAHRAFLDRQRHQARARRRDQIGRRADARQFLPIARRWGGNHAEHGGGASGSVTPPPPSAVPLPTASRQRTEGSPSKPRSTNIRRSAVSKCSSCRTARATRPNGSRRSNATPISSRCSSLIRCSPAASASATRTSACATANGSRRSSAGSGSARPTAAPTRPRRRCSRRSACARWR